LLARQFYRMLHWESSSSLLLAFTGSYLWAPRSRQHVPCIIDENGIDDPEPEFEGYAVYSDDGGSLRFRCNALDAGEPIAGISVGWVPKLHLLESRPVHLCTGRTC